MKELRKKTNLTLIAILSMILLTVLVLVNVRAYVREEEGIERNLNILEERGGMRNDGKERRPGDDRLPEDSRELRPRDLENMMVMDYELYTVEVENGEIAGIYSHGNSSEDFDAAAAAEELLSKEKEDCIHTGNLYFSRYSYRYRYMESIVILNAQEIRGKLWELLAESLVLLAVL